MNAVDNVFTFPLTSTNYWQDPSIFQDGRASAVSMRKGKLPSDFLTSVSISDGDLLRQHVTYCHVAVFCVPFLEKLFEPPQLRQYS